MGLKNRVGLTNKNRTHTIGLGLAGSKQISKALDGDVCLKESKKFLTIFAFKIPVKVTHEKRPAASSDAESHLLLEQEMNEHLEKEEAKTPYERIPVIS
mmetsp:Transcript_41157/g.62578  ORF Transcript_41157/g.62578 Transcript_41157/m.62578 type:complete len:99 (+) Transcript_41157:631-927(+)